MTDGPTDGRTYPLTENASKKYGAKGRDIWRKEDGFAAWGKDACGSKGKDADDKKKILS